MNQGPAPVGTTAICGYCGASTPVGVDLRCAHCGGGIRALEPFAVECGWCDASNRRDQTDTCRSCGGPLPALPGGNPGPRPPEPVRRLPEGYENRIKYWKNVFVLIGMLFTLCFFWTIVFAAVGIPMWIHGKRRAERKLAALGRGLATRGRITKIEVDTSEEINGRNPWRIDYEFDMPSGKASGWAHAWDPSHARRSVGDVLWIVYVRESPDQNAIWPPIH
jgi:hypothetical protein